VTDHKQQQQQHQQNTGREGTRKDEALSFADLRVGDHLEQRLAVMGIYQPAKIQSLAVPIIRKGKHTVVIAGETGSGKTLAYLLPVLAQVVNSEGNPRRIQNSTGNYNSDKYPSVLVLAPRLELLQQVHSVCKDLLKNTRLTTHYMADDLTPAQAKQLNEFPNLLVTTPRTLNVLADAHPDMWSSCRHLVVDEADIMMLKINGGQFDAFQRVLSALNRIEKDRLHLPPNSIESKTPMTQIVFAAATLAYKQVQGYLGYAAKGKKHKKSNRKKMQKSLLLKRFEHGTFVKSPRFHHRPTSIVEQWVQVTGRHTRHYHLLKALLESQYVAEKAPKEQQLDAELGEANSEQEREPMSMSTLQQRPLNPVIEMQAKGIQSGDIPAHVKSGDNTEQRRTYASQKKARSLSNVRIRDIWKYTNDYPFHTDTRTLIFCDRIEDVTYCQTFLLAHGVTSQYIHEKVSTKDRITRFNLFLDGTANIMICTDMLARGMDLAIDHVIQLDFAPNTLSYVHRIGRTGRAGRLGLATNIYDDSHERIVESIRQADDHGGNLEMGDSFRRKKVRKDETEYDAEELNMTDTDVASNPVKPRRKQRSRIINKEKQRNAAVNKPFDVY
jgi:superfamily II DNA/RNA helicase